MSVGMVSICVGEFSWPSSMKGPDGAPRLRLTWLKLATSKGLGQHLLLLDLDRASAFIHVCL